MKHIKKLLVMTAAVALLVSNRIDTEASSVTIEGNPGVNIESVSPGEDGNVNINITPNKDAGIVDVELNGESITGGVELPPGDYKITGIDKDGNKHEYDMSVGMSSSSESSSSEWREEWSTEKSTEWYSESIAVTTEIPEPDCPGCPEDEEDPFEEEITPTETPDPVVKPEELESPVADEPESPAPEEVIDKLPQTGGLDGRMTLVGSAGFILILGILLFVLGFRYKKK